MKLLTLDIFEIEKYVEVLEKECEAIQREALQLAWAMRGGIQYNDVLNLSANERKMIAEISKENIELTKKTGLPYF